MGIITIGYFGKSPFFMKAQCRILVQIKDHLNQILKDQFSFYTLNNNKTIPHFFLIYV